MTRFNYLGDSLPSLLDRVRATRVPDHLRTPLSTLAASIVIVIAWWGLERHWLSSAHAQSEQAALRLAQSRAQLAQAQVERLDVDRLVALDSQLRIIRLSGARLGVQIANVANHLPEHSWLTSLAQEDGTLSISGRADGMVPLSETLADMMTGSSTADPTLVRATREERPGAANVIAFEVRATERVK